MPDGADALPFDNRIGPVLSDVKVCTALVRPPDVGGGEWMRTRRPGGRIVPPAPLPERRAAEQTMGMPATRRWTTEEVRAMQDEDRAWPRYELLDGELLVTPAPSWEHQAAVLRLWRELDDHVRRHRLGAALASPADIELEPGTVLQPDVFVVPARDVRPRGTWRDVRGLLLASEVLSPSSGRQDRVTKRRFFQRQGVPEYWIVDVGSRLVERWRSADERPEVLDGRLLWHPEGATEPFVLDLPAFFACVHGEEGR